MAQPGNKIPEETRNEVKRRLEEGESPEDLADDDDLPSRRTIYNIKDEMESEIAEREEMEKEVFRGTTEAGRDDIINVLELAGVGVKTDGEPKAKVKKALNAIEMDSAWDDPHYVRDILYDEAGMTREWANRVVRKAYDRPDFPYQDEGRNTHGEAEAAGRGRGRTRGRRGGSSRRSQRGRGGRRGGQQDRRDDRGEDDQLRREMQQLRSTVSDLAETVAQTVEEDDKGEDTVTIERNGNTVEVPMSVALANGMLDGDDGGGDDKDFMDKLREAKEAGIIPDPEDFQQDDSPSMMEMMAQAKELGLVGDDDGEEAIEVVGEMMDEMSKQFAQAQEATAQQMSAALSQLAEEEDEDDDLSLEDVKELIEEERKQDKIDQLAEELNRTREELREELDNRKRRAVSPENDPEVVKHQREMDFKENQLEALNENIRTLPDQLSRGVQDGLLPLFKQMQLGAVAQESDIWSPPEGEGRGQPGYEPDPNRSSTATPESPDGRQDERGGPTEAGYPEPDSNPSAPQDAGAGPAQDEPQQAKTAERARSVRDKLGLNDNDDNAGAEA